MTRTHHYNGLKTAVLLGGMWSLLLLLGYALTRGTGSSIWLFIVPIIGIAQTAFAFWNSDKIAVRSMGAIEVTEDQQPQMYAIVRELSAARLPLAREARLPVCIHDREAHGDTLRILEEEGQGLTGVLHCYSGSLEMARELWKMGFYIGIDGPLTYKNAAKLPDIVRAAPRDRLLIETDSPYLAPVPLRGKRNEPAYVVHVAAKIAEVRGESIEEVARYTTENALRLYPKLNN